ncbi:MAG: glycosyltransferase, partial [Thermoproteota archaeon]
MLELIALILAGIHFGVPLAYYYYAKTRWLPKPWNIKVDENYKPRVTIIVPTYKEAEFIWDRLDNIYAQNYPRNMMEVIVVDSASDDGTVDLVKRW